MKTDKTLIGNYTHRLQRLQEKFQALEPKIGESDTKQAISILYGMFQEIWRHMNTITKDQEHDGLSVEHIVNMYQHAPKMEGPAINTSPLPIGTMAPEFSLKDAHGDTVKLSEYKGSTVLLVFYPLDWSPGCSQQLDLYQNEWIEFEKRGVKVLGISVDSIYSHGVWATVRRLRLPLLADFHPKGEVAKKYHVYRESDGFAERALYIIDGIGVIRYSYISPYLHHVPDVYELFKKLDDIRKSAVTF